MSKTGRDSVAVISDLIAEVQAIRDRFDDGAHGAMSPLDRRAHAAHIRLNKARGTSDLADIADAEAALARELADRAEIREYLASLTPPRR